MVETKSLFLENKTNRNGYEKCLSQSLESLLRSVKILKFQYITASLGLTICHTWLKYVLIAYKVLCMIPL